MPLLRFAFGQMGSPCELVIDADDTPRVRDAARAAIAEVARLDRKYSHYRDDSLLAEIERDAQRGAVTLDAETAALFDFAAVLHAESGGRFDVACGALVRAWDPQRGRVPDAAERAAARAASGWSRVAWRAPTLRIEPGVRFDLGGVVKEYAVDRAAALLREADCDAALVELGGDVAVTGPRRNGEPWKVGVRDPLAPSAAMLTVPLAHGALATSGDYARHFEHAGRRYTHVVDPTSGSPVEGVASVSVAAPSCLVAGGLATVAMLLGRDAGAQFLTASGARYAMLDSAGVRSGGLWA